MQHLHFRILLFNFHLYNQGCLECPFKKRMSRCDKLNLPDKIFHSTVRNSEIAYYSYAMFNIVFQLWLFKRVPQFLMQLLVYEIMSSASR